MKVTVTYTRVNSHLSYTVQRGKITAAGDDYPATSKGEREMKRDCAAIVRQLKERGDQIIINRHK
jgi:hypothetical protein